MISVKNIDELHALQNHEDGEYCIVEDTKEIYQWTNGDYVKAKVGDEVNTGITIYELNQQLANQLEPLDDYKLTAAERKIEKLIWDKNNKFYMLLCNELKYYTVFCIDPDNELADAKGYQEVMNCLRHMGDIKLVENTKDEAAIEAWVTCDLDSTSHVFYLFPYDEGIIVCK